MRYLFISALLLLAACYAKPAKRVFVERYVYAQPVETSLQKAFEFFSTHKDVSYIKATDEGFEIGITATDPRLFDCGRFGARPATEEVGAKLITLVTVEELPKGRSAVRVMTRNKTMEYFDPVAEQELTITCTPTGQLEKDALNHIGPHD